MDNLPIRDGQVGNDYYTTLFDVFETPAPHPGDSEQETGFKFIINKDSNKVLSCMTDDYKLVPNKELVEACTQPIIDNGGILTSSNMFGEKRTHYKFDFPDSKVLIRNDEEIIPQVSIRNSYDGTIGVNIIAGAFRMLCSNGLIIGKIFEELSNRHLQSNQSLNELDVMIANTISKTTSFIGTNIDKLDSTELKSKSHILDIVKMFPQKTHEAMVEYAKTHKINTYWDLLNLATWNSTHNMNRKAESTHKLEGTILNKISSLSGGIIYES